METCNKTKGMMLILLQCPNPNLLLHFGVEIRTPLSLFSTPVFFAPSLPLSRAARSEALPGLHFDTTVVA